MDGFTNTKRERYVQKLLKTRKPIVIDNALMRGLGYESTRTFFEQLGNWGYNSDFGRFSDATDTNVQSYIRAFIHDNFVN